MSLLITFVDDWKLFIKLLSCNMSCSWVSTAKCRSHFRLLGVARLCQSQDDVVASCLTLSSFTDLWWRSHSRSSSSILHVDVSTPADMLSRQRRENFLAASDAAAGTCWWRCCRNDYLRLSARSQIAGQRSTWQLLSDLISQTHVDVRQNSEKKRQFATCSQLGRQVHKLGWSSSTSTPVPNTQTKINCF